jgi:hypothetical protein
MAWATSSFWFITECFHPCCDGLVFECEYFCDVLTIYTTNQQCEKQECNLERKKTNEIYIYDNKKYHPIK